MCHKEDEMRKKTKFYQFPRKMFTYKNCWVALTPDGRKVVVTAKKLDTVLEKSAKLGIKEPRLIWAPKTWGLYVLSHALSLSKTHR